MYFGQRKKFLMLTFRAFSFRQRNFWVVCGSSTEEKSYAIVGITVTWKTALQTGCLDVGKRRKLPYCAENDLGD